jgi:O-antigen/teichoic acid export membrane protein
VPIANVIVSQTNTLVITACSFLITPAVIHGLGDDAYGGWLLINSFVGYMKLLDLGTSGGTVKYGAGAHDRGDAADLRRVFDTSTAMFLSVAILTLVVTGGLSVALPRFYPGAIANQSEAIAILGVATAIDLGFRPYAAALRMRSLHFIYDAIEIATFGVFKLGLLLYYAYRGTLDYHVLAVLTFAETVSRLVFVAIAALVVNPATRRINPFHLDRGMMRKLATMGVSASLIQIADLVRFQVDAGVIGWRLPEEPKGIAIFGVGTRLPSIAFVVIGTIGSVLMPRFSGLAETKDHEGTAKLLRRADLMTGLVASLVLTNLMVLGPQFLMLWLHKPWIPESGRILQIMVPGYFIAALTGPSAAMIYGRGSIRGLMLLTVAEAAVNLAMSVLLVGPLGLYGVAIGTAVPLAVFRGIIFPLLVKKEMGIAPRDFYAGHTTALLVTAIYALLIGGLGFVTFSGFTTFFAAAIANVVVFLVLASLIAPEAREVVKTRFLRRRSASQASQ